jgi:CspA family cold shock protein
LKTNGTVKWFNDSKGYGFIAVEKLGDAFVHYSDIEQQIGRKTLKENQEVRCEVIHSIKGLKAVHVEAL